MSNQSAKEDTTMTGGHEQAVETNYASKIDFLKRRLHYHIDEYKDKRDQSRKLANIYKFILILLGGLITLLLAVKTSALFSKTDEYMTMGALLLSAVVTTMTSWEAFADYRGKWTRTRSILVTLYNIRDDLRYELAGNEHLLDEKVDQFYKRLQLALNESNEQWMGTRGKAIADIAPVQK